MFLLFIGPSAASLPLSSHRLPCSRAIRTRVLNHKLHHDVWGVGDCADGPEPSTCGAIGAFQQLFTSHDPVVLVPVQPHNLREWSREPIVQRTGIRL